MSFLKSLYIRLWWFMDPLGRLKRSGALIGKDVFIGNQVYIELENARLLTIEDNVTIAARASLILHDSSLHNVVGGPVLYGKIILRRNCYIGANTTILPGTEIGRNTIVGAHSLVKGKLKANSVYLGQPARYYCSIKELEKKWQNSESEMTYLKKQSRWNQR